MKKNILKCYPRKWCILVHFLTNFRLPCAGINDEVGAENQDGVDWASPSPFVPLTLTTVYSTAVPSRPREVTVENRWEIIHCQSRTIGGEGHAPKLLLVSVQFVICVNIVAWTRCIQLVLYNWVWRFGPLSVLFRHFYLGGISPKFWIPQNFCLSFMDNSVLKASMQQSKGRLKFKWWTWG